MKRILLLLLALVILVLSFIVPEGIRTAVATNMWSVSFFKNSLVGTPTIDKLFTSSATHAHAGLLQARVAMEEQDFDLALQLLEPLLPTTDPVILETYAELLFSLGQYPESFENWKGLGMYNKLEHAAGALFAQGQSDDAILALQKAYDLRPDVYKTNLLNARLNEADKLRDENHFSEAVTLYQAIIEQFPDSETPLSALAWSYSLQGENELAVSTIEKGMQIASTNYSFFMTAGRVFEQGGNWDRALDAYQAAHELSPNNQDPIVAIDRVKNAE